MQSCDAKCMWCAKNFWAWLKSREAAMSRSLDGCTPFATAAKTRPTALEPGVLMLWTTRNLKVVVLADSGNQGLDGRHWVKVRAGMAWEVHVERNELV